MLATAVGTGQKQTVRREICGTTPDKLHLKNRNSGLNVTCLEKAKHPLHCRSVIACGVCVGTVAQQVLLSDTLYPGLHHTSFPAHPVQKELLC